MIALLALFAVLALASAPAADAAVLTEEDAAELANSLAEATYVQGVCYGWRIDVLDPTGVEDGPEHGSSFGPGEPLDRSRSECRDGRFAELVGFVRYTSESSEAEDSASWAVESNVADPPRIEEIEDLGYDTGDLLGDENDTAIVNAVGALPQLVADRGNARPVPFAPEPREPGTGGEPTGDPGSDLLREHKYTIGLLLLMTIGGLAWLWWLRGQAARREATRQELERRRRDRERRRRTTTTAP